MRVGIDPGIHGAIALIWDNKVEFFDMPTMRIPWAVTTKYKTMVDVNKLYEILEPHIAEIDSVTMEIVGVRPNQGNSSNAVLVASMYSIMNTIKLIGIEPIMVHPGKWKRKYGLIGMDKDYARLVVLKMYPNLAPFLKRKKDVDRAEALLIGCAVDNTAQN